MHLLKKIALFWKRNGFITKLKLVTELIIQGRIHEHIHLSFVFPLSYRLTFCDSLAFGHIPHYALYAQVYNSLHWSPQLVLLFLEGRAILCTMEIFAPINVYRDAQKLLISHDLKRVSFKCHLNMTRTEMVATAKFSSIIIRWGPKLYEAHFYLFLKIPRFAYHMPSCCLVIKLL